MIFQRLMVETTQAGTEEMVQCSTLGKREDAPAPPQALEKNVGVFGVSQKTAFLRALLVQSWMSLFLHRYVKSNEHSAIAMLSPQVRISGANGSCTESLWRKQRCCQTCKAPPEPKRACPDSQI